MRVFLCEKPSQARDIAKVLGAKARDEGYLSGKGVAVTWCFGHLFESAAPESYDPALKQWRIETLPIIPSEWKLELKSNGAKQFKAIKQLLKKATEVVIATDADREGETIGREVLDACGWRGKVSRLWLSALDEASIRKALAQLLPGEKTAALYAAGQGRARADWLVGMNLTRVYTLLGRSAGVEGVLSVGRVQTPTLRLIVDRDRAIEHFVPVNYFDVQALVQPLVKPQPFKMRWQPGADVADSDGRCLKEAVARSVAKAVANTQGRVEISEIERKREAPPLPYDLSTLQQDCSRLFGMTATETLEAAQRLYETHKAATYPRTDCQYLPLAQFTDATAVLAAVRNREPAFASLIANANLALQSRAWNDSKITAHHAIIPTAAPSRGSEMTPSDRNAYQLIVHRYLAQFYSTHEYDQRRIQARFGTELFSVTGRTPIVAGWKTVFAEPPEQDGNAQDEAPLPAVKAGDTLQCLSAEVEAKQTKPPQAYSEGTLIQAMKSIGQLVQDPRLRKVLKETSGIGTEATRAAIIETLMLRQYIEHQGKKKRLVSTAKGRLLVDAVPEPIKDPAMTALWEQALEEIAMGKSLLAPFMERQTQWVKKLVEMAKQQGALRHAS